MMKSEETSNLEVVIEKPRNYFEMGMTYGILRRRYSARESQKIILKAVEGNKNLTKLAEKYLVKS